jgi:N-acylneuraminate cytidylyltransferase
MRWLGLLPLRAGSKAIPGKNIRAIAGRPLFAWCLDAALESGVFDRIYVASDGADIRAAVAAAFGDRVDVIDRAAATATDTASSESVMHELAARVPFDVLGLIQATSPLTRAADFRTARRRFEQERLDSLLTAVRSRRFYWSEDGVPLNYDPRARPRRQDLTGLLQENGAFYFTSARVLAATGARLGGRIGIHVMDDDSAVELDEPADWARVEALLRQRLAADA